MWCETDGVLTTRYLVKRGGKEISCGYILQDSCEVAGNLCQLGTMVHVYSSEVAY